MAAPVVKTFSSAALRLCGGYVRGRSVCTTRAAAQAGIKWRREHGLALNGSRYGPLTDLPDWSFADGRGPAPPMAGQQRRRRESEELSRRVVALSAEMDGGIAACARRREEAGRAGEHGRSLRLKPKGSLLLLKKSEQ